MSPDLERKLVKDFPKLFGDVDKSVSQTLICFGCECNDGWFNILYELCVELADMAKKEGQAREDVLRFSQIKEKFGELCIYTRGATDEMQDLISKAEYASAKICEECGKEGSIDDSQYWVKTLCQDCKNKRKQRTLT
jgi:hypothetical protein